MFNKSIGVIFALCVTFLISLHSQAIGRVGNGGNIIVCISPLSNECYGDGRYAGIFYDSYEADVRYKLKPLSIYPVIFEPEVALDYAVHLMTTIKPYDQEMYDNLYRYLQSFYSEANFIEAMKLLPIPDTGISFIPYDSELRQLVVQREPIAPQDKRYVISLDLWQMMGKADQAHAILHEVLYRYALDRNATVDSSEYIRYFNAILISGELSKMTQQQFTELKWIIFR